MPISLRDIIQSERDNIVRELLHKHHHQETSPYKEFITSDIGSKRLGIFIDLIVDSLDGKEEQFILDQQTVGYERAISGFDFDNVSRSTFMLQQILNELINKKTGLDENSFFYETLELNKILLKGFRAISNSFLRTREERLREKINQMRELYIFTHSIIYKNGIDDIIDFTQSKIKNIFSIAECVTFFENDSQLSRFSSLDISRYINEAGQLFKKAIHDKTTFYFDNIGKVYKTTPLNIRLKMVLVPLSVYKRAQGLLILYDNKDGIRFTEKELAFFNQIIDVLTVALKNALMLAEINKNRNDLQLLAKRMITIQEDERKRLASDIHDTIAQILTGVSFKIQYCKELLRTNPATVAEQLENLAKVVNIAVDHSRKMISSLRPDLIDTIGLVAALEMYIAMYEYDTGINVLCNFPRGNLAINSDVSVCIFRIAQEALMNVYKHANSNFVKTNLKKDKNNVVLTIQDYGSGFDNQPKNYLDERGRGLGLLSIKERVGLFNGDFYIESAKDKGCRLEVKIPL